MEGLTIAIETTDIEKVRTLLRAQISSSQNAPTARQVFRTKFLQIGGYSSLDTLSQDYKRLFGAEAKHQQGGEYLWDGYTLSSSQYGTQGNKTRPQYEEGDRDFGLFSHFETFSAEMQFEQDGLRTHMTWKLSDN